MKCSLRLVALGCLLISLAGCIKVDTSTTQPTRAAELIDLSRAKSLGELSEEEFAELRKKVLASF